MADTDLTNPLVYEHSSDNTATMGMGHVPGVLSCVVESKYDNAPQLTMIVKYSERAIELLQQDRILLVDAGDAWKKQMFRIYSISTDWSDTEQQITVLAAHVGGDLFGNVLAADLSIANASPQQLWGSFLADLAEPVDIQMVTSITDVAVVNWDSTEVDSAQSLLFGRDSKNPSFTSLYNAEWWFDNYEWHFEKNVGRDTGIVIKYGKHLKSLQNTDTTENVYTAVRPISKYTPGQTGTGDDSNVIALDGTAMIQYAGTGGLPVFDTPFKGQVATGKTLTNGSRFKIYSYAESGTVNDHTWYNLGGKQWVDGNYLSFDKGQTGQFPSTVGNKATGKGTIAAGLADKPGVISKYDGVITVNYVGPGKVAIWDSPWAGRHVTGSYMANGSAWNAYGKATDESGQTWYNLGGNQWVSAQYVALDKAKDYAYQKVRGIGTAKVDSGKIALWNRPSFNGSITRMISSGTRWQIYGEASGGGSNTWYDLGGSQWIDGQYMDFSAANDVEPKPVGGDSSSNDTSSDTSDTVWSYNSPGTWNTRVKQYTTGNQVTIYGQGTAGGATWYNIGTNEWLAADYLTFDNNTDVDPSGSADDMTAEATEVTVTLPEKYIAVPMPDGQQYEHQRIVNFDASSYNIDNVDDLRSITQAYIRDNNIGKPQITLTIDYDELQGHYQNLESVRCYDVVTVFLPEINLNIKAEVTDVIYDTLLQANTQVTIGNRPLTTTDDLQAWVKKAEDKASTAAQKNSDKIDAAAGSLEAAAVDSKQKIAAQFSQVNVRVNDKLQYGQDQPTNDAQEGDTWFKTHYNADGYPDYYTMMVYQNGKWVAAFPEGVDQTGRNATQDFQDAINTAITNAGFSNATEIFKAVSDNGSQITTLSGNVNGLQATVKTNDSSYNSQFTQLSNAIDARVTYGDLNSAVTEGVNNGLAQISLSVSGGGYLTLQGNGNESSIYMGGSNIHIDGNTYIENGIIKSAMIESVDVGKLIGGTLQGIDQIYLNNNDGNGSSVMSPGHITASSDVSTKNLYLTSGGQIIFNGSDGLVIMNGYKGWGLYYEMSGAWYKVANA
ncbi:MAG: phage tail spike protein [Schleiferilactobacillus harbinensis]|uniref:phage tail spike protein n=1 Tax=Schleiferilactobacillus harbinensis TaxID=304207 RepID=UPI0039E7F857